MHLLRRRNDPKKRVRHIFSEENEPDPTHPSPCPLPQGARVLSGSGCAEGGLEADAAGLGRVAGVTARTARPRSLGPCRWWAY